MCMKNINATTKLYDHVVIGDGEIGYSLFQNQFDVITAKFDESGNPYIGGFYIVTDINLLGTSNENDKSNNVVEAKKSISVKIRVTKLSQDPETQYSWDLDTFDINMDEDNVKRRNACVPYVNYTKVSNITKIPLEKDHSGEYVVKVLLRDSESSINSLWAVQSISRLCVK